MGRRTTLALGLAVAAMSGGCGTVTNLKQPTHPPALNPDAPVCRVYGGVRADAVAMVHLPWSHMPSYIDYGILPVMCVIDLVCTTVGDTVTLPYTVGSEIDRAFFPPKSRPPLPTKPNPAPVVAPEPPVVMPEP